MSSRAAFILGISLILAAVVVAVTYYDVHRFEGTIVATGSARMAVTSDSVVWNGGFSRVAPSSLVRQGYDAMRHDAEVVTAFFKSAGIGPERYTLDPVSLDEIYDQNSGAEKRYTLRQTFSVHSPDVAGVTQAAADPKPVLDQGVLFTTYGLEYYYSKLPEARVSLLGEAVADARRRAKEIGDAGGAEVGALRNASLGPVQVLGPQSVEVSGGGAYDTRTVDKDIMVTVRAEFGTVPR
ncbi:MAG: SIMPL domain-containing protein [Desulfovibrionaceae bacterium]